MAFEGKFVPKRVSYSTFGIFKRLGFSLKVSYCICYDILMQLHLGFGKLSTWLNELHLIDWHSGKGTGLIIDMEQEYHNCQL